MFARSVCCPIRLALSTERALNVVLFCIALSGCVCDYTMCVLFVHLLLVATGTTAAAAAAANVYFTVFLYFTFILFNWYNECLVFFCSLRERVAFDSFTYSLSPFRSHHFTSNSASYSFPLCSQAFGYINPFKFYIQIVFLCHFRGRGRRHRYPSQLFCSRSLLGDHCHASRKSGIHCLRIS